MNLLALIQAYDGCKRLGLDKAQAKLDRLITKVSAKLLKDFNKDTGDVEEETKEESAS